MNTNFLHPGKGKPLHATNISGVFTEPRVATIPAAGYSEAVNGGQSLELIFHMEFAASVAAQEIDIERSKTSDFTAFDVFQTEAIVGDIHTFASGKSIYGYFRVRNRTTEAVNVWLQERIN